MKAHLVILALLLQGCFFVPCAKASEADADWKEAVQSAKQGENDFAFMHFQAIVQNHPDSRFCMPAEFALGEYYFLQNNLPLASETFEHFNSHYPKSEESLMALAYLYKIAQIQKNPEAVSQYHNKAASFHQLAFVFNERKSFSFLSGFGHRYKLSFYIDKIELYADDKLFTTIPL